MQLQTCPSRLLTGCSGQEPLGSSTVKRGNRPATKGIEDGRHQSIGENSIEGDFRSKVIMIDLRGLAMMGTPLLGIRREL